MVSFTPASAALTAINYAPKDHTTYTGTATAGQVLTIYKPALAANQYEVNTKPKTGLPHPNTYAVLMVFNLSSAGANGTTSSGTYAASGGTITSAQGLVWQALMRGIAVVQVQLTAGNSGNAMTGKGLVHLPGGTAGLYESRTTPNALKDTILAMQHIRWNCRNFLPTDVASYGLCEEAICIMGASSSFSCSWIGLSPNRAQELGTGGPYDMSTVPNCMFVDLTQIMWWDHMQQTADTTIGGFFPQTDGTGAAGDALLATGLTGGATPAPTRYRRGWSGFSLISDKSSPCTPYIIAHGNTPPGDMRWGQPFTEGVQTVALGIHDTWQIQVLHNSVARGRCKFFSSTSSQYLADGVTQIPRAYWDDVLSSAETGYVAATGTIQLTGQPSDADGFVLSDGVTSITYEFDSGGGVTGTNTAITIGGSTALTYVAMKAAIVASGQLFTLSDGASNTLNLTSAAAGTAGVPSTNAGTPGNITITKGGANITVAGMSGGANGASAVTDENPDTGKVINEIIAHINDPRWDAGMPAGGISRRGQVNTTGRICVPANPNRAGVWVTCTSIGISPSLGLQYGWDQYTALGTVANAASGSALNTRFVPGTGPLWLNAIPGAGNIATYECREVPAGVS